MTTDELPATSIAASTMLGDLMALVIDELKAAPDVWQRLAENEQSEVIDRVRRRTAEAVEQCVELIAVEGFARIRAKVDSVTVKDGIKAVLTLSQHDAARHDLVDAQGATVYIVVADPDQFSGGTESIQPEPDQGALVLGSITKIGKASKGDEGSAAA